MNKWVENYGLQAVLVVCGVLVSVFVTKNASPFYWSLFAAVILS